MSAQGRASLKGFAASFDWAKERFRALWHVLLDNVLSELVMLVESSIALFTLEKAKEKAKEQGNCYSVSKPVIMT